MFYFLLSLFLIKEYVKATLKVNLYIPASKVLLEDINCHEPDEAQTNVRTQLVDIMMKQIVQKSTDPAKKQMAQKYMKRRIDESNFYKRHVVQGGEKIRACTTIDGMCLAIQGVREDEYNSKQRVMTDQPPGLTVQLKNYQRESLTFMLECENREQLGINDCNYLMLQADDGTEIAFSPGLGQFAQCRGAVRGGILAEGEKCVCVVLECVVLLFVVCCLLFVVCCLLFVVCCLLLVCY